MVSRKGDPEQARKLNTCLILDRVRREEAISRADLARALSISKMTASSIVSDLLERGLLVEDSASSHASPSGGRPPVLLSLDTRKNLVVGIDVGTTTTALILGNLKGETLRRMRVPTRRNREVGSIADQIEELLPRLLASADLPKPKERILGVGVSVAGLVDKWTGYVKFSPDFNWRNVYFKKILEERLELPVVINNCTRVAALGEMWYGAAKDARTFFYVNVGYGIGSAIVINRRLYEHNSEFGHINVTNREVKCDCGKFGCLEAVSSGHAIERDANSNSSHTDETEWITAKELAERALAGDGRAKRIYEDAGKYLGRGIATVTNLLSPELVILGGGVSNAGTLLMVPLMEEFTRHTMEAIRDGISVEVSSLGVDAGVIGAVALALDTFVFEQETIHGTW